MERKQRNFMAIILSLIAIYITSITATADVTKNIKFKKENSKVLKEEKVKENKKIIETKENAPKKEITKKSEEKPKKIEIKKEVDVVNENKTIKIVPEKKVDKVTKIEEINYSYVKNMQTPIYNSNKDGKIIDKLARTTRVEILETVKIDTSHEKKIKKKDGTIEIKIIPSTASWSKIKYEKNLKTHTAWIKSDMIEKDRTKVLDKNLRKSDFTKIEKLSYKNNPRRNDIRGIYISEASVGYKKRMDNLINLTKTSDINAFVIDVKDDFGNILFKTEAEKKYLGSNNKNYVVKDINKFVKKMKDNNIYLIARIVSFKSPRYSKKNPDKAIIRRSNGLPYAKKDGVPWSTAYNRDLWEYNIAVAREAAKAGFNEIQFDYVRFPASNGGKLDKELNYRNDKNETKPEAIQKYLKYARKELSPLNVYISADIYGQVGTSYDDMGLGQHWETISNVVDFICPMAYPSHYGKGVYGLTNPDANPYKTIYYSTLDGINRNANIDSPSNIRPWLQAFTAKWVKGHIPYGKKEIKAQTKALKDLGINEYLLWSASNKYDI